MVTFRAWFNNIISQISLDRSQAKNTNKSFISKQDKSLPVLFWNGGGRLKSRISVNPGLNDLPAELPDVFVYAEALLYRSIKSSLKSNDVLVHPANRNTCKRGRRSSTRINIGIP